MTIKYLVDGKDKRLPSHYLIAKIELHLNYVANYELSPENSTDLKTFLPEKVDDLSSRLSQIMHSINQATGYLGSVLRFDKNQYKIPLRVLEKGSCNPIASDIYYTSIEHLIPQK